MRTLRWKRPPTAFGPTTNYSGCDVPVVSDDDSVESDEPRADDAVRVWLVERTFVRDELGLVSLVYATPDGERYVRRQVSTGGRPGVGADVSRTAAAEDLRPVEDDDRRERYASEAARMAERHDPGETV